MCNISPIPLLGCASLNLPAASLGNRSALAQMADIGGRGQTACGCREYFVDMMLSQTERPMLLEECSAVQEHMDGKVHSVEILRFRFRQGTETVGVKTVRR